MVHVHGPRVQVQAEPIRQVSGLAELIAVPIDVGKASAMALVADFTGQRLAKPFTFALDRDGLIELVLTVEGALEGLPVRLVRVGVEAAGHYHRPLTRTGALPSGWEVVELNPAHVTAQRRVNGQRGIKTDQIDLTAIFDLIVAGRGYRTGQAAEAMVELAAWVAHRRRRVQARIATKNQLLGQVDRAFPGADGCLSSSLLATKVGRLVIGEFTVRIGSGGSAPHGSRPWLPTAACRSTARLRTGSYRRHGSRCPPTKRWWPVRSSSTISPCSVFSSPRSPRPRPVSALVELRD
jgi:hypothetical protein